MSFFRDWLFNKLPNYYHINDSYKDVQGRGVLQRYLMNVGDDIDINILPFIDSLLDIIDPTTQASTGFKYLNSLAYTLGNPPDIFLGNSTNYPQYAKLLSHIISIYKVKGTKKSFQAFFALLGYTISVIEYPLDQPTVFDSTFTFDAGFKMDLDCEACSEYNILSQSVLNNGTCGSTGNPVLDPSLYSLMVDIAKLLQPINTQLKSIISGGLICEDVIFCYQDDITFTLTEYGKLDIATYKFDNVSTFDEVNVISTTTVSEPCTTSGIGSMEIENTFIVG